MRKRKTLVQQMGTNCSMEMHDGAACATHRDTDHVIPRTKDA